MSEGANVGSAWVAVGTTITMVAVEVGVSVEIDVAMAEVVAVVNGSRVATLGTFNFCPKNMFVENPKQLARCSSGTLTP